jgi:GNAT superfamily N-acetyltransferase
MIATNEPDGERAPRLFLGRTCDGNLWRFRDDLPDALVRQLETILAQEPVAAEVPQLPITLDPLRAALDAHSPVRATDAGPAWRVPFPIEPAADAVMVTDQNVGVLRRHFPWTAGLLSQLQPCAAIVDHWDAVSVCCCARITTDAAEASLNTVEAYRGRGYAVAVVAAWARAVRQAGRIPLYSTSWENVASQRVARKLGLVLYGADCSLI